MDHVNPEATPSGRDHGLSVSVVLIVKNGERYIGEALESVFLSEVKPAEILVVDGGSTDRTVEVAKGFPLVRLVAQASTGIANAYNEGIAHATGDLIAFISHDDLWLPGKLDRQVAHMEQNPELLFTVTMVEHFLDEGAELPPHFRSELLGRPHPGVIMETLVARKRVFDVVGLFDPSFPVGEDTDWYARAKDAGVPMAVLPEVLVRRRVHATNSSLNEKGIDKLLLRAMRNSVARKREAASGGRDDG